MIKTYESIKFNMEYMLIKDDESNILIEIKSHQTKMSILSIYSILYDILSTYNEQCDFII